MNDNKKYVDLPGLQDYDKGVKDALGKIQTKVDNLENEKMSEITDEEIEQLFRT